MMGLPELDNGQRADWCQRPAHEGEESAVEPRKQHPEQAQLEPDTTHATDWCRAASDGLEDPEPGSTNQALWA